MCILYVDGHEVYDLCWKPDYFLSAAREEA